MNKTKSILGWLTQTRSKQRRAPLLAAVLVVLLILMLITIIIVVSVNQHNPSRGATYTGLIFGLGILLGAAYAINRAGYYTWAASLTVLTAILGPGGSLLLDPTILKGDFVPLNFGIIAILTASIFLTPTITTILAVLQAISLVYLSLTNQVSDFNWISLLMFTIFASVLIIMSNIQITRTENELIEQAARDHLTKLYNRRFLDEFLKNEFQRARRNKYPVSVIMLDLDHFKKFNDSLGHAAGDALLQALSEFLSSQVRQHDIVCRYGGEEFVLILPEVPLDLAVQRSEELRKQIPAIQVEFKGKILDAITVSIGVAEYNRHGETRDELLNAADSAMMRAKKAGRNQVTAAQ